ncbi:MAG: DUF5131 family protein [Verrucomicrobia bacterium]|nr:DUF5131 family protein [Verrucomicrobiota bacterium]
MKAEWVRSIRGQCTQVGVAFFFKQWGGVRKSETGCELDGKTYSEFPARNPIEVPSLEDRRNVWLRLETDSIVA